jgi:hypothetical protein
LRAIQNGFEKVLTGKVKGLMDSGTFAAAAGSLNVLDVPILIREYLNEKGEGRRFNLKSFEIRHETDPNRVAVDLLIGPKGAEQDRKPGTQLLLIVPSMASPLFRPHAGERASPMSPERSVTCVSGRSPLLIPTTGPNPYAFAWRSRFAAPRASAFHPIIEMVGALEYRDHSS